MDLAPSGLTKPLNQMNLVWVWTLEHQRERAATGSVKSKPPTNKRQKLDPISIVVKANNVRATMVFVLDRAEIFH
jgi:hypothetical protein